MDDLDGLSERTRHHERDMNTKRLQSYRHLLRTTLQTQGAPASDARRTHEEVTANIAELEQWFVDNGYPMPPEHKPWWKRLLGR